MKKKVFDILNREISIGDLVVISDSNCLRIVVCAGVGRANNLQFFPLNWVKYFQNGGKGIYKCYINTNYRVRHLIITKDCLDAESLDNYNILLEHLKPEIEKQCIEREMLC